MSCLRRAERWQDSIVWFATRIILSHQISGFSWQRNLAFSRLPNWEYVLTNMSEAYCRLEQGVLFFFCLSIAWGGRFEAHRFFQRGYKCARETERDRSASLPCEITSTSSYSRKIIEWINLRNLQTFTNCGNKISSSFCNETEKANSEAEHEFVIRTGMKGETQMRPDVCSIVNLPKYSRH